MLFLSYLHDFKHDYCSEHARTCGFIYTVQYNCMQFYNLTKQLPNLSINFTIGAIKFINIAINYINVGNPWYLECPLVYEYR